MSLLPADSGVHVFYSLTRSELVEVVRAIVALRLASGVTTDLGPLAVHPVIRREGLGGAFSRGLAALLAAHVGPQKVVRMTRFASAGSKWIFSGVDVAAGGGFTPMTIPTLPPGTTRVTFSAGPTSVLQGTFDPRTSASDDMQLLANLDDAKAASTAARAAAFGALLRIEDPTVHSPNTIDCASCHVSGPAHTNSAALGLDPTGDPNLFRTTSPFIVPDDLVQTTRTDPSGTTADLHVFSYKGADATIAPRVIHETAVVVDILNSLPR